MIEEAASFHVGVDGYNLALAHGTGVATYGRTLAQAIALLGRPPDLIYGVPTTPKVDGPTRESLFYGRLSDDGYWRSRPKSWRWRLRRLLLAPTAVDLVPVPATGQVITTEFAERVPAHARLFTRGNVFDLCAAYFRRYRRFMPLRMPQPPRIMHWTYPLPVRLIGARNIYTIHDLVPLRLPHTSLEDKRYYSELVQFCARTGDHIVTVSEASKRDIVELLGVAESKVTNCYQPIDTSALDQGSEEELDHRLARLFDLPRDGYFLFFGAIEPKKNVGRIVEAYLRSEVDTPLVVVGTRGWRSDQELRLLSGGSGVSLPGAQAVRQIEHLPRRLLLDLVRGARAVLFPSLYEGFGLPAVEAMALGTAVLTSEVSALPEVAGGGALYVDPYDVGSMASAIRQLDGDRQLRKALAAQGKREAARFDMSAYCTRLAALYGRLDQGVS